MDDFVLARVGLKVDLATLNQYRTGSEVSSEISSESEMPSLPKPPRRSIQEVFLTNYGRWHQFTNAQRLLEQDRDFEIDVCCSLSEAIKHKDDQFVQLLSKHLKQRQTALISQMGEIRAFFHTKTTLRCALDRYELDFEDLSPEGKCLLEDYFSHGTTESQTEEGEVILKEAEETMDLLYETFSTYGFDEKVQCLIWEFVFCVDE